MRLTKVRMLLATVTALALMVGVGTAIAATTGGGDLKQEAARITARSSFEAAVAKNLGTTAAKLKAAVTAAATARIDAALAADEITAAEAATLKGALADGMPAMRLATAAGVAKAARHDRGEAERRLQRACEGAGHGPRRPGAEGREDHREVGDRAEGEDRRGNVPRLRCRRDAAVTAGRAATGGPGGLGLGFGPPRGRRPSRSASSSSTTPAALALARRAGRRQTREGRSGAPHRSSGQRSASRRTPRRRARGRRGDRRRRRRARSRRAA